MSRSLATLLAAATLIGCSSTSEQPILNQFFTASRLRDNTTLAGFAVASFEPGTPFPDRLFDAYKVEVAHVDQNGDGVISAVEGDVDSASDNFEDNSRLFLPATSFDRFAVTREINDGMLAPRFAPSQKAWVLTGSAHRVDPAVAASAGRDSDDR